MKLYLIRHAQSENNANWQGSDNNEDRDSDPEITAAGHQQAEQLAQHLAHPRRKPHQHPFNPAENTGFGLTHVYCSLMTRSILTASYIAKACKLELQVLPDIFEKYGIYEFDDAGNRQGLPGHGLGYFTGRFPAIKLPVGLTEDGWWNRPAETNDDFQARVQSVVENLSTRYSDSDDCIAMVVHGDFMDQFINELPAINTHASDWTANGTFHNASLSRIDFINASHNVVYLNRIDHLPEELITC